jgi:hypothetical protein
VAFVVLPFGVSWERLTTTIYRDNFDVLSVISSAGPTTLLAPLFAVLVSCVPLYQELGNRYIANTRTRVDARAYVGSKLLVGVTIAFVTFFVGAFGAYLLAFVVWPALGNPSVLPENYFMSPQEAAADSLTRASYSQMLAISPLFYGIVYSAWVGLGGAVFAAAGFAALVLVKNRALAMTLPLVLYFVQTLVASLVGEPTVGLMYSLWPFGLNQVPFIKAGGALLIAVALTLGTWIWLWKKLPTLTRLS